MPIITISLILNLLAVGAAWLSRFALAAKVIITVLLVLKFCLFIYSTLIAESNCMRRAGLILCGVLSLSGTVYTAVFGEWAVTVPLAIALLLLIIWRIGSGVFSHEEK